MADRRELCVGGKPLSSLRVVDLKVELEKRSLPKSGSKKELLERLRLVSIEFNYLNRRWRVSRSHPHSNIVMACPPRSGRSLHVAVGDCHKTNIRFRPFLRVL